MWELFWIAFAFAIGSYTGQTRATNIDITEKTSYMQDLIDEAYEKRDAMKKEWIHAEAKAETWQRRYWALVEELESEEDGSGSSDDGSHEGSKGSNQLQEN